MTDHSIQQERIDVLEDILLRLHHGASPESVQADFNKHFTGVSAIEISMMEHQLMHGDSEITFEDILSLCNVHANLFKDSVLEGETADIDKPGHPVRIFKDENFALRSALLRIHNLLDAFEAMPEEEIEEGMLRGMRRQFDLIGQFDIHYERKEKVFFPLLEKYGHDAPPKVMWAKDDEIRVLFKEAYNKMKEFPKTPMSEVKEAFAEFEFELNEMIFKEEAILINILLEALTVEDWYQIAEESDPYGYAIIRPNEKWVPDYLQNGAENASDETDKIPAADANPAPSAVRIESDETSPSIETRKIEMDGGYLTVSWEPKPAVGLINPNQVDFSTEVHLGDGYLTINQMEILLEYMPIEITYVDKHDLVRFSNYNDKWDSPYFARDYAILGRSVETIYPRDLRKLIEPVLADFRNKNRDHEMIVYTKDNAIYKIDLHVMLDSNGEYDGYFELIHCLQPYHDIKDSFKRKLTPIEEANIQQHKTGNITLSSHHSTASVETETPKLETRKLGYDEGELLLTWESLQSSNTGTELDQEAVIQLTQGELSISQIHRIFNSLPFEVSFVDTQDIFQYYNNIVPYSDMIFKRTPVQAKRNLELCHPPYLWPMVNELINSLKNHQREFEQLWYKTGDGQFIFIMYQGTYDTAGKFQGILETVLNIQPLIELT